MPSMLTKLALAISLATACFCVSAQSVTQDAPAPTANAVPTKPSTAKGQHGWFWYDDPAEAATTPPPPPPPVGRTSAEPTANQPEIGSGAWIAANIDKIRNRAIDNPTKDNIELFAYVQKLMMDKSEVFANAYITDVAANPALDETSRHPVSGYANFTVNEAINRNRDAALSKISKGTAIWYFFKSDCPYCQRQSGLLQKMAAKYGFDVLPISLDDLPQINGDFPDWVPDQGQGRALGVTATPTMYLVHPETKQVVFLESGLRALPELETRVMEVAKANKWLTDQEYEKAMLGLPQKFLTTTFRPEAVKDPNNSAEVLAALRAAGMHSVQNADMGTIDDSAKAPSTPWMGKP